MTHTQKVYDLITKNDICRRIHAFLSDLSQTADIQAHLPKESHLINPPPIERLADIRSS